MIPTPCIGMCEINEYDMCPHCLRSMDEIREWLGMTDEQKKLVLENIKTRKSDIDINN